MGFSRGGSAKELLRQCKRCMRCQLDPWVGKIPWRRARQPTPVFLPGESHGQRAWQAVVQRAAQSQTPLKRLSTCYQILLFCCVAEAYEEGSGAFPELFYFMNNCLIVHFCWTIKFLLGSPTALSSKTDFHILSWLELNECVYYN